MAKEIVKKHQICNWPNNSIEIFKKSINDHLKLILQESDKSPKELNQAMKYSVMNGGKRIRPLMMLASAITIDVDTEKEIKKAFKKLEKKKTIIIVAHRLSTIVDADKIYVVKKGNIIEEGTYSKLSKNNKSSFYKMLSLQENE